jgi:uncharacterized protein (DUF58 family)
LDRHELLEKITVFPLSARVLAEDLLSGNFRSVFKGQGIEFAEVRRYELGDDVRSIDWNVSARFGTPYVKMYREERELTVCIILDNSASMHSAGAISRYDQAVLAAALVAFSAEQTGQRVGALCFDQGISRIFTPRKGRAHIMTIISGFLENQGGGLSSDLGLALAGAGRFLKRRSLVVILSDFLCVNWEQELGDLCARHDVIAIGITDPLDKEIPGLGLLSIRDPETALVLHAPTSFPSFREAWSDWHIERARLRGAICRHRGASYTEISTSDDAPAALARFFGGRHFQGDTTRRYL